MKDLLLNRLIELGLPEQYSKVCLEELFHNKAISESSEGLASLREAAADLLRETVLATLKSQDEVVS